MSLTSHSSHAQRGHYLNKITLHIASLLLVLSIHEGAACEQHVQFDPEKIFVIDTSFTYSQSESTPLVTTIGTIKNTSNSLVEDIVIEVKYFNAEKKLVDVVTQPLYGVVVPAFQEVAFRVRDAADKPKTSYTFSNVRMASAEQRVAQQSKPKQSSFSWSELLVSWGPMLMLIGVWVFFMRKMNKKGSYQFRTVELIDKQNAILERIATAAEKVTLDK
jgi:ATP-dependent Zn protease